MLVGTGKQPSSEEMVACVWRCGFVFTKEDLTEVRGMPLANKVEAGAHASAVTPCEATVPVQSTSLRSGKTSFFQALGITTEMSRYGTIDILKQNWS